MSNLVTFLEIPSQSSYLDPSDLDALRLVSIGTKEVATQDRLWALFARSVGCEFLHSREDVKWYLAELKEVGIRANNIFFPVNQFYWITSDNARMRNQDRYTIMLNKAPKSKEVRELKTVRENVDIGKIRDHLFGYTYLEDTTNGYIRENFNNKIKKGHYYVYPLPPTDLQVLDLSGKKLTYLPPVLSEISTVQHLNLANNEFREIPEGIKEFPNLQSLDLSGNQIESIPSKLGQLTNLQRLCLSNNSIRQLPDEVESMPNCEILIDGNPLAKKRNGEELESSPKKQKSNL